MNKSALIIILGLSLSSVGFAQQNYKDVAREMSGLASGAADTINHTSPDQFAPRYEGVPANSDSFYGGGNIIPKEQGSAKINNCQNIPEEDLYLRQECEGINFVGKNRTVRPDVTISSDEKLATGTHEIVSDPTDTLTKYGWVIPFNPDGSIGEIPPEACNTEIIQVPEKIVEKNCSIYQGVEHFLCVSSLEVKVDPNFNYSCLETKFQNNTHACQKKLEVQCETALSCADQGVVPGGTQGDMRITYSHVGDGNFNIFFGNPGNDYWSGNTAYGAYFERTMTVNIRNLARLQNFYLLRTQFDDHLLIKVNNRTVFFNGNVYGYEPNNPRNWWLGAPGRNPGQAANDSRTYCGWTYMSTIHNVCVKDLNSNNMVANAGKAERSTSWDFWPSLNLIPFLQEGVNEIRIYVAVGGKGEVFINFRTQQACEPVCQDRWQNNCTEYENRK
ncbi:hypothetical protein [Neisseria sp. Ec49-e6-T10]|uniref:hypothetical protein n=1 Tax=Neisseria sp. Ec49-e6-T10 TaxID=3140744 RepID=UPI003EC0C30E